MRTMKTTKLTHDDFPTDVSDLTATQYGRLLDTLDSSLYESDRRRDESDRDLLTGLWNLRGLDRRTALRDWGWWVVADLDAFKAAQDRPTFGHAYGDTILVEFAEFVSRTTRRDDIVARTGGDEFRIWTEKLEGAVRLRDAIRAWRSEDGQVSASAGVGGTAEAADLAMYTYKSKREE